MYLLFRFSLLFSTWSRIGSSFSRINRRRSWIRFSWDYKIAVASFKELSLSMLSFLINWYWFKSFMLSCVKSWQSSFDLSLNCWTEYSRHARFKFFLISSNCYFMLSILFLYIASLFESKTLFSTLALFT